MQQDWPLRNFQNTPQSLGYVLNNSRAGKLGVLQNPDQSEPGAPYPSLETHHMQPGPTSEGTDFGGPASKRPRVEDAIRQHAPREQMLVSELMGWRNSSQEPMSALATSTVPKGSTDFRALFSRQPSQQQHLAVQRAPSIATTGLRTFADVASRPADVPEDLGRQEVLGALRAAYNTTGPSTCSGVVRNASQHAWPQDSAADGGLGAVGAAGTAAAGAIAASALEDLDPERLPVDWCIKRSATFTSSSRFGIHDKAQQAPPGTRWRALQSVVNGDLNTHTDEAVQYLGCQLSWRHPEMQLDASALAAARSSSSATAAGGVNGTALVSASAGNVGSSAGGLLTQRVAAWRSALHSLYGTYRGGDCHQFYVMNLAVRNPFVALFIYKGIRGSNELCAVVSQSSRVLRNRMLAAGVPFTMPLEKTGGPVGSGIGQRPAGGCKSGYEAGLVAPDDEADAVLCDEGPQMGSSPTGAPLPGSTVADNSRESLLLLRGPRAVHGLYDFLLNETSYPGVAGRSAVGSGSGSTGPNDEVTDLPLLVAPVPFDGGTVWRPSVKALMMNSKLTGSDTGDVASALPPPGARGTSDSGAVQHVLQVTGPLPPWTIRRMCALLARLQPSGFTAVLETEPCSIPLNSRVVENRLGAEGESAPAAAQLKPAFVQGGALTIEELSAWQQPAELPGGRPVKGVACNSGRRLNVRV